MVRTGQPVLRIDRLCCRHHKMCKLPVCLIYLLTLSVTEYGKLFLYRLGQAFRSSEGWGFQNIQTLSAHERGKDVRPTLREPVPISVRGGVERRAIVRPEDWYPKFNQGRYKFNVSHPNVFICTYKAQRVSQKHNSCVAWNAILGRHVSTVAEASSGPLIYRCKVNNV